MDMNRQKRNAPLIRRILDLHAKGSIVIIHEEEFM